MSRTYDVGPGWQSIVQKAVDQLIAGGAVIDQVKEKYGGLRIYYHFIDDRVSNYKTLDKIVQEAENECAKTCEQCGEPGVLRDGGWIRTLCDKHEEEYQQRKR